MSTQATSSSRRANEQRKLIWIVERWLSDSQLDPVAQLVSGQPSDSGGERLTRALHSMKRPITRVKRVPFSGELQEDGQLLEEARERPCFAYGSTSLEVSCMLHGIEHGYLDAPGLGEASRHWGEHMLNADMQVSEIGQVPTPREDLFLRPEHGDKKFAGLVVKAEDFEAWREQMILQGRMTRELDEHTKVCWASPKAIEAEWRMLISDRQPWCASRYRLKGKFSTEEGCPPEVVEFAADMARKWSPRPAYFMDIALSQGQLKIVELSGASSAGLYQIEVGSFIHGIERALRPPN